MAVIPSDGFRYYGKLYNTNHGAPAFQYIYDSGIVWQNDVGQLVTGAARPVIPSDLSSTTNIDVSGGLSVSVGNVAVTGGNISINNSILPFSGVIQGGNLRAVYVTGQVIQVITGGSLSVTNPIGVTGIDVDSSTTYSSNPLAPYNFLSIGGRIVNPSGEGSVTGDYSTGEYAIVNFAPNGGIYINQGCLESGYDSVTAKVEGGNAIPVLITGGVSLVGTSLSFDSTSIVNAQSTGNNYLAFMSGKMDTVVPVSGVVTTNVSITNIAVTGGQIQTITTGSFSATVDNTLLILAVASGNAYNAAVSGLLASNLSEPANVTGVINLMGGSSATTNGPSGVAPWDSMSSFLFGQALAANTSRIQFGIQNIHTGIPLYVNLGATAVSTGVFSLILHPNSAVFVNDRYKGAVQASGGGWVAWEI